MVKTDSHPVADGIVQRFTERTGRSRALDARARARLPGGETRSATYYLPYAAYMARGAGSHLFDSDGNEYLDLLNNYTSLIHGHCHEPTAAAARRQLELGVVLGSPAEVTVEHAELLCSRVPSLEMVRYCNSGTEATLFAIRAARAFTRRDAFVKIEGGYHGSHDAVEVSITPDPTGEGYPTGHLDTAGVPANVLQNTIVAPYNDIGALETILEANRDRVAAVIMEPLLGAGGGLVPRPGYLKAVRELTRRLGLLLIFDEIITLRLSTGGAQAMEGVVPDLTALGKIIGGGFPVGAFGGRRDLMAPFDPAAPNTMNHSGTFSGNNITMAAGLATLKAFDDAAVRRVNALGDRLRDGFNREFKAAGITGQALGRGSLVQVHWRSGEITNTREAYVGLAHAGDVPRLFHLEMVNRGVLSAPRGWFSTSTPMTEPEIDRTIEAFALTLKVLKPYIADRTPHLLAG